MVFYTFYLRSDDGSKFYIGGHVLDNDGMHDATVGKKISLPLRKGIYSIKIEYFENDGDEMLQLDWKGPNFERRQFLFDRITV